MRIRIDKWLVVLAVIGLSTLSWWMPIEQAPVATLVSAPEKRHIIDYFLSNFDLTTMNAEGRPRYYLQADWMQHYKDDDTSQLTKPRLTIFRPSASRWFVSSNRAVVAAGGESVLLQDDVKLQRLPDNGRNILEIDTSSLRVLPDKEFAETDQPVAIVNYLGITRAVGMQADLKRQRLILQAQVRGVYARQ